MEHAKKIPLLMIWREGETINYSIPKTDMSDIFSLIGFLEILINKLMSDTEPAFVFKEFKEKWNNGNKI